MAADEHTKLQMCRRKRLFPLTINTEIRGLWTKASSWRQGLLNVIYFVQLTLKETMNADCILPSKLSPSQIALPPRDKAGDISTTWLQASLTSVWPSLPFNRLWWWQRKSPQLKFSYKLNMFSCSRIGNWSITVLHFVKMWALWLSFDWEFRWENRKRFVVCITAATMDSDESLLILRQ